MCTINDSDSEGDEWKLVGRKKNGKLEKHIDDDDDDPLCNLMCL